MTDTLQQHIKEVSKTALQGYYQTNELEYKSKVDLVTEYDKAVEKELTERFAKAFSQYTIIGEEYGGDRSAQKQIIIDPIDGTTNFVHQIPIFGISVGVVENGQPVAGVVYNPVLDEMYTAQKGQGSYCNGKKLSVSGAQTLQESLIATGFPYTKIQKGADYRWVVDSFERILPKTRDIRRLGAASIDL
ncbi:MAG: inositol monophosphatase family protein, partial [Campylobacterota bacterium]